MFIGTVGRTVNLLGHNTQGKVRRRRDSRCLDGLEPTQEALAGPLPARGCQVAAEPHTRAEGEMDTKAQAFFFFLQLNLYQFGVKG